MTHTVAFLGIDPGLDGAVATIRLDGTITLRDTPTGLLGKKRVLMPMLMVDIIRQERDLSENKIVAVVEQVHALPPNMRVSPRSMFNFGEGYGMWEGILAAFGIPFELVSPQRWKTKMLDGIGDKTKDASRFKAMQLFPGLTQELALKKHHGRAEALLLACWRQRMAIGYD